MRILPQRYKNRQPSVPLFARELINDGQIPGQQVDGDAFDDVIGKDGDVGHIGQMIYLDDINCD